MTMDNSELNELIPALARDIAGVKKVSTLLERASICTEKLEMALRSSEKGKADIPHVQRTVQELYRLIQSAAIELYRIGYYRPPCETGSVLSVIPQMNWSEENETIPLKARVFCRVNQRGIFVRTPELWTKNGREQRNRNGAYAGGESYLFFKSEVMEGIKRELKKTDFSQMSFQEKLISFLYVYPSSMREPPPDNDNHETKYLIDAIALMTPGGDGAYCTSLFSSAVKTDQVFPGCYISLTAAQFGIPSANSVISFWENEFGKLGHQNQREQKLRKIMR